MHVRLIIDPETDAKVLVTNEEWNYSAYIVQRDSKWDLLELKRFLDNMVCSDENRFSNDSDWENLYVLQWGGRKWEWNIFDIWQNQVTKDLHKKTDSDYGGEWYEE